jgi:WD40 repeat protein
MGHIKFWRMSSTFTGLKLQGYLGKFGTSELTDICAFIQLPDGKVLSSTETGNMLLWDGGMIKCEIALKGKRPCHQGKIEVIMMNETEVITAGEDGFIRVWDFETIDNADVTTTTTSSDGAVVSSSGPAQARIFEMDVLEEYSVGKDVRVSIHSTA